MKTTLIILAATLIVNVACAQRIREKNVPVPVKKTFQSLYPSAKRVVWEKENGYFEAEFNQNKAESYVLIDVSGNLKSTGMEINESQLPKTVFDYCLEKFPGKKISEATKIIHPDNTYYQAEIKGVGVLIFDTKGNFLRRCAC